MTFPKKVGHIRQLSPCRGGGFCYYKQLLKISPFVRRNSNSAIDKVFRMTRTCAFIVLLALAFCPGCVERALVITSDPPGAQVTVNQQWTGTTPFVVPFKHYGVYDIWIEHPGIEENGKKINFYPLHVGEPVKAPGYQYAGADFVTEVLLPTTLQDQHNLHYVLERVDQADEISDVLARAADLRAASQARTDIRRQRDADRYPAAAEETTTPQSAGGVVEQQFQQEYYDASAYPGSSAPGMDYYNVQETDIDATPPSPSELPVFTN